jgi:hypothetical protein
MNTTHSIDPREAAARAKLMSRLPAMRDAALGQRFVVKHADNRHMRSEGRIVHVEHGGWYYTGRSVGMLFKVTMECGTNAVRRTFTVRRIPA